MASRTIQDLVDVMPDDDYKNAVRGLSTERIAFIIRHSTCEFSGQIEALIATLMVADAMDWECSTETYFAKDPASLLSMGGQKEFDFE